MKELHLFTPGNETRQRDGVVITDLADKRLDENRLGAEGGAGPGHLGIVVREAGGAAGGLRVGVHSPSRR